MRIALITADFAPNIGGVASHVVELGKALAELGEEVHVITSPLGGMREANQTWQGMQVHRPRIPRGQPLYGWLLGRWLKKFCREYQPDILHVHGLRPLEASRNMPIPVIFTNHTSGYLKRVAKGTHEQKRIARRLTHIAHVLAPSQELCDATKAVGYSGPIDFITNGVDTDRFTPNLGPLRARLGIQEDEVVVLLARRLVEKNGVTVFAEAVSALKDQPVRLLFAGDGSEQAKVEAILKQNGLYSKSIFMGAVPNPDMPDVYRAADISVLPSFMEATSITGLESMACGLPLVGTRVGGIPTLVTEGETGLLVEPGNPVALGEAIHTLVENPAQRQAMGQAARQRAVNHFSWSHIATVTRDIYRKYSH
jgi:glycosyltransferase involved in cell wall biosynthesis